MFNWPNLSNDFNFTHSLPVVLGNLAACGAKEYFVLSRQFTDEDYVSKSFIVSRIFKLNVINFTQSFF